MDPAKFPSVLPLSKVSVFCIVSPSLPDTQYLTAEEVEEASVLDVSREPVILNIYDMFWTNDYTGNLGERLDSTIEMF